MSLLWQQSKSEHKPNVPYHWRKKNKKNSRRKLFSSFELQDCSAGWSSIYQRHPDLLLCTALSNFSLVSVATVVKLILAFLSRLLREKIQTISTSGFEDDDENGRFFSGLRFVYRLNKNLQPWPKFNIFSANIYLISLFWTYTTLAWFYQ